MGEGARLARRHAPELIVAVGGGSAMDCAKAINLVVSQDAPLAAFRGGGRAARPLLPALGVPTTAGTGSEAQSFALIGEETSGAKMACGDPGLRFAAVLLDPELPPTAPRAVAAAAAIDGVSHAVESHVSRARNALSQRLSAEAFSLLEGALEPALGSGDAAAWGRLLLGAYLAGAAIERSMLGAAHALANPLTARHAVVHGVAVGVMLPHVVRFNAPDAAGDYARLFAGSTAASAVSAGGPAELAARIGELLAAAGIPARLGELGVPRGGLGELAVEAAAQWTATFNPRRAGREELEALYEAAY